jgi:plastocyanin
MTTHNSRKQRAAGFTFAEAMVAMGISSVVGLCAFSMLSNATILYAKNTAENAAHDQNRIAVNRMVHDIHAATSIPQLGHIVPGKLAQNPGAPAGSWTPYGTNVTFWADGGTGPAAGVSFKKMGSASNSDGGPFKMKNDPGNKDMIQIYSGGSAPHPGMEIIFPYYGMEGVITKVTSNGANHYNVWAHNQLETRIKEKGNNKNGAPIICYYMSRFAYVVENGELHFYSASMPPDGVSWPITVSRNIVEPPSKITPVITVNQDTFSPGNVTIRRGESVRFTWNSSGNRSVKTSLFASPQRKNNDPDYIGTFIDSGTYQVTCPEKSGMTAVITVLGRDSNAKPFSQTNSQYVTINLTTEDNRYSNRNYKTVNTLLAGSVPIRAQLSKTQ